VGSRNTFSFVKWHFYIMPRPEMSEAVTATPGNAFMTCIGTTLLYKQQGGIEV
jgi:hypothetical protein